MAFLDSLGVADKEVYSAIALETKRQEEGLELIPSENFVSRAVMEAAGSTLTNKYSEGYSGKRYYGGNKYIDIVEDLAIERAKKLFGAEHVNVQPYSGSPANIEVYFALLSFGGKIMGMSLAQGGHLTHGHKVNFSGKAYEIISYGVEEKTHRINYDEVRKLAKEHKPKLIVSGATAYPREIDFKQFAEIAEEVGAVSMADISHIAGLIIGGVHPSPFPFTDIVTTTTHKTLRGPRGAMIMCKEKFAKEIDRAVFPGMQGGPHNHITAAKAVAFGEALKPEFKEYARQIVKNARALAEELMAQGFDVVSGGTDNHLILIDLTNKEISGKQAEGALDESNITCNKNMVPFDKRSPFDPSGIRLGTPALTTRGMKEGEMKEVGSFIARVISNWQDEEVKRKVKGEVVELTKRFPLYPNLYRM
ncbi:serine hydroxymethyltransferase [Candidatus Micrarchaeota archaeon CG1_02_47_40]|nr:MAG: serine hydroxymethyltransferase [Candidatus Micrarchaeota archaeon CG1_02_47_40]